MKDTSCNVIFDKWNALMPPLDYWENAIITDHDSIYLRLGLKHELEEKLILSFNKNLGQQLKRVEIGI